ncbi:hypothetical protein CDG81_13740 [Actinopolyspora erythraea]|uniref:Tyr recombinase domain-containing protein n=2 Tax=Actinopolyspora erythraea TaxID=414996 RepID=A0A223RTL3_9ACTN|nr:hypothetical protein [Actinopolyspora erythraea]ASU79174.1 hypothetical protein CDG81_13740 [Actinopolyspora erythraea]
MAQHHRLVRVRRLATDHTIPLRERVAGLLVLLYAQLISRIARMTTHDVITHHDDVLLNLGESPTPAPALLDDLLTEHTTSTEANHESNWLFPGRQPGQPLQHRSLGDALRRHEIPIQTGRTSALRHLVLQAPAPVVATMLGFHDKHTTRVLTETGGAWNRYVPSHHNQ